MKSFDCYETPTNDQKMRKIKNINTALRYSLIRLNQIQHLINNNLQLFETSLISVQYKRTVHPNPSPPGMWRAVLRIRIRRIHMFLGILDPEPDPLDRDMDPDPSIIKQNSEKNIDSNCFVTYVLFKCNLIMYLEFNTSE